MWARMSCAQASIPGICSIASSPLAQSSQGPSSSNRTAPAPLVGRSIQAIILWSSKRDREALVVAAHPVDLVELRRLDLDVAHADDPAESADEPFGADLHVRRCEGKEHERGGHPGGVTVLAAAGRVAVAEHGVVLTGPLHAKRRPPGTANRQRIEGDGRRRELVEVKNEAVPLADERRQLLVAALSADGEHDRDDAEHEDGCDEEQPQREEGASHGGARYPGCGGVPGAARLAARQW